MRQNRIECIDQVPWLGQLEELDLYDNGLRSLEHLGACAARLRYLDVSFNRLGRIRGVQDLANLEELYLISNGIERIEGLPASGKLRLLELGANKITVQAHLSCRPGASAPI